MNDVKNVTYAGVDPAVGDDHTVAVALDHLGRVHVAVELRPHESLRIFEELARLFPPARPLFIMTVKNGHLVLDPVGDGPDLELQNPCDLMGPLKLNGRLLAWCTSREAAEAACRLLSL